MKNRDLIKTLRRFRRNAPVRVNNSNPDVTATCDEKKQWSINITECRSFKVFSPSLLGDKLEFVAQTFDEAEQWILARAVDTYDNRIIYRTWEDNGRKYYDVSHIYYIEMPQN